MINTVLAVFIFFMNFENFFDYHVVKNFLKITRIDRLGCESCDCSQHQKLDKLPTKETTINLLKNFKMY